MPISMSPASLRPNQPRRRRADAVRQVAERAEFSSREPERKPSRRVRRTYRTGRNGQFSVKADPEVIEKFYAIADAKSGCLGKHWSGL